MRWAQGFGGFFGHVNIDDALAQLPAALNEPAFLELLHLIGRPRRSTGNRRVRTRGIPQGSSLSPLIANLALTDVDNAMCDAGYGYVRFADDIVVGAFICIQTFAGRTNRVGKPSASLNAARAPF